MLSSVRAQLQRETLGIELIGVCPRELHVETREAIGHGVEVARALVGRRRVWIPCAGVVRDLRPAAGCPGPAVAKPGNRKAPGASVARIAERQHELGGQVLYEARLHLTRVIAGLVEERARIDAGVPVDGAEKEPDLRL